MVDLSFSIAALNAGTVAVLCAAIAAAAWRAMVRTGNARIQFVVAAFALFSVKNFAKAYLLIAGEGYPSEAFVEVAFSLADLVAVGLVAWPLLSSRTG